MTARVIVPHGDPTDENGITALMRAAARGDAEMVELLIPIQKGAEDKDRGTAFFMPSGANAKASLCSYRTRITLPSEKCLMQSSLAGPDRPVLATSQSPSSC